VKVLITGGYFDASGECFVDEIDLARGVSRRMLSFFPAPNVRVPAKGFTGGCWLDSTTLLVCSFNAVHRIDANNWRETGRLEQADFNDLHHVSHDTRSGHIFVCNTGLDAVEVFDAGGRFVGRHATSPAWFEKERLEGKAVDRARFPELLVAGWSGTDEHVPRRSPQGAYYANGSGADFGVSLVRDYLHPNHAVAVDGLLAVTMLGQREVRCLWTHQVLAQTDGHPHDGQLEGCDFWTTTTRGVVTAWDRRAGPPWRASETYEVFASGFSGWCRGLYISSEHLVVGLTEMRSSPQYAWCDRPLSSTSTAVVALERGTGRLLHHARLGEPKRHPKIFSILPSP
jgi:hypothetical protein